MAQTNYSGALHQNNLCKTMSSMIRRLGGINDFECAARRGSFKDAATELHKTAAAVSMQVKQLEKALGFALFIRHARGIELTDEGRELANVVGRSLAQIEGKIASLREADLTSVVRVTTTHSFAMKWLAPRLHRLTVQAPTLDIRIQAADEVISLEQGGYDVAIRHGRSDQHAQLFTEWLVPVVSSSAGARTIEQALKLPLLHEGDDRAWRQFLEIAAPGVNLPGSSRRCSHAGLLVQAAVAGLGVALVPFSIACEDILAERLRIIPSPRFPSETGFRLIVEQDRPAVAQFIDWLKSETGLMERTFDLLSP